MIANLLILLILFYRKVISPWLKPRCRFEPTCSHYAIHALQHHGAGQGLWLIMRRLTKCHPFGSYGIDPVPVSQPSTENR